MVASKYLPTPYSPRRVKRAGSGPMICISLFCRCTSKAMRISWVQPVEKVASLPDQMGGTLRPMSRKLSSISANVWKRQTSMKPLRCTRSHMNMRSSPSMPSTKCSAGFTIRTLSRRLRRSPTKVRANEMAV